MIIESPVVTVTKSNEEIISFLSDLRNFKQLMPENTTKFEVTGNDTFKFALQGMPEFELKIASITPNEEIILQSANDKTPFELKFKLHSKPDQDTKAQFVFEGEFNAMMAMMIKSPINKFLSILIQKISTI